MQTILAAISLILVIVEISSLNRKYHVNITVHTGKIIHATRFKIHKKSFKDGTGLMPLQEGNFPKPDTKLVKTNLTSLKLSLLDSLLRQKPRSATRLPTPLETMFMINRTDIDDGYIEMKSNQFVACLVRLMEHSQDGFCTATFIHKFWAITAASCINDPFTQEAILDGLIILRGGTPYSRLNTGFDHHIVYYTKHPKHVRDKSYNLALLQVTEPFINFLERPIQDMASPNYKYLSGSNSIVYGWGPVADLTLNHVLQHAYVKLLDNQKDCNRSLALALRYTNESYPSLSETSVCSVIDRGSFCMADIGGPLIQNGVLIAIASWNMACHSDTALIVYTKIHNFGKWIRDMTHELYNFVDTV